ncbi:EG45-like domain containing protein [Amborella trichopoda]|nr:EG45-like domain containing protein [Amborella trichopoda]|eukprot:XP_006854926.2 EG45-like domain containing protein [Amborella trichopoda]
MTREMMFPWLIFLFLIGRCSADVGTATFYNPPYVPTKCYGNGTLQFPADNLFAAASDSIWDNGAACAREYSVRCLSAAASSADPCVANSVIQVRIVDFRTTGAATMFLSSDAFQAIAHPNVTATINFEFKQV